MLHTHQQSFTVTQAGDSSLAGTSFIPRPDHRLLCIVGGCCFTALQRKPTFEDLALAEEILLSSAQKGLLSTVYTAMSLPTTIPKQLRGGDRGQTKKYLCLPLTVTWNMQWVHRSVAIKALGGIHCNLC